MRRLKKLLITVSLSTMMAIQGWAFISKPKLAVNITRDGSQVKAEVSPKERYFSNELRTVPEAEEQEQKLRLELLGTAIGNVKDPIAFIKDLESNKQGIYKLGSKIRDAKVIKIVMGEVVLERNGKKEILRLSKRGRAWSGMDSDNAAIISRSEDEIVVSKRGVLSQAENILNNVTHAKIKPYYEAKKVSGMTVEGIDETSIIAAAGIQNKDIIKAINNQKIDSYQKALQVFKKVQNQSEIKVSLIRGGELKQLCYRIAE